MSAAACAALGAAQPPATRTPLAPTVVATGVPTVEPTPAVRRVTATPPAAPLPTATPQPAAEPTATATLISEVLSRAEPPAAQPTPVRGGTVLPVPPGTSVNWSGCASDGTCNWYNFYWAPTREIVMQAGEGPHKVAHERCHAHQHWSINGGEPLAPSDYDLESWYGTAEGVSFSGAVAGLDWPWTQSARNGIEDFAWTCAYWYYDPGYLLIASPPRYEWAAANLP